MACETLHAVTPISANPAVTRYPRSVVGFAGADALWESACGKARRRGTLDTVTDPIRDVPNEQLLEASTVRTPGDTR
jgi:hypothetical protein